MKGLFWIEEMSTSTSSDFVESGKDLLFCEIGKGVCAMERALSLPA
jgi:hypothetical protein